MIKKDRSNSPSWVVTLRENNTGKQRIIEVPGGLHEPQAMQAAHFKAGPGSWRIVLPLVRKQLVK